MHNSIAGKSALGRVCVCVCVCARGGWGGQGYINCDFSYDSELENMCELCVDLHSVRALLPVIWHVVDLTKDSLHQALRTPNLVLKIHTSTNTRLK